MESQNMTAVLIADSQSRRDSWLLALRQLHGLRIYDVRYAYPWRREAASSRCREFCVSNWHLFATLCSVLSEFVQRRSQVFGSLWEREGSTGGKIELTGTGGLSWAPYARVWREVLPSLFLPQKQMNLVLSEMQFPAGPLGGLVACTLQSFLSRSSKTFSLHITLQKITFYSTVAFYPKIWLFETFCTVLRFVIAYFVKW